MPQKSIFQTVLMLKGLVFWKTSNLNLISWLMALAENLAFLSSATGLLVFQPFLGKKS